MNPTARSPSKKRRNRNHQAQTKDASPGYRMGKPINAKDASLGYRIRKQPKKKSAIDNATAPLIRIATEVAGRLPGKKHNNKNGA